MYIHISLILWYVFCFLLLICFFFKQKTAYEMRISDWSSDVCSSDLLVGERLLALHAGGGYEIPDIGVVELRDLYFWHGQLVRSALNPRRIEDRKSVV